MDTNNRFLLAVSIGKVDLVKKVVAQGADIHFKNDKAITIALDGNHLEVMKVLVELGLSVLGKDGKVDQVEYVTHVEKFNPKGLVLKDYEEINQYLRNQGRKEKLANITNS